MASESFEIEALNHINDINDTLNMRLTIAGLTRKECLRALHDRNKDDNFTESALLGFAIWVYQMAKAMLEKKDYRFFFTALHAMHMFIDMSNDVDKKENAKKILSDFSKANALKRHAETYELKEQAKDYWRKHIDPKLSNPKAADILIKVVPVSHRKLVEYVAEAKRENIRSAS